MPKRKHSLVGTFQHNRLHSLRSIRILILRPSPEVSAPLDVDLLEIALDDLPSDDYGYEALSYVWGNPMGTIPCTCDGMQLLITPNCDAALRHLRLSTKGRTLWVDAICIDQGRGPDSFSERNVQITLMGEIYRNATQTLCWLGVGESYSAGTFERLRQIGECPSKRELRKFLQYDEQLQRNGLLESESTSLNHIFCHSWHSRIWTVQEVAFSGECQVICGKESIPWDLYFKAAKFLVYEEFVDELDAQAWKNYVSIGVRDDMRQFLLSKPTKKDQDGRNRLLTAALTQVRHLHATNPKDKIYGLYAAFSALDILLPSPDYGKPLATIYEETCLAVILHSESLQMLSYASSNARASNLPSWVADWEDEDVTLFNPPAYATEGSRMSPSTLSLLSLATGKLVVRGKMIGLITARSENDFASSEFPAGSLSILQGKQYNLVGTEVESLRLLIHRIRLFREWRSMAERVMVLPRDEEPGDIFHQLLTFDSAPLDARLFNAWSDILSYPETSYSLSRAEMIVEMWKSSDKIHAGGWCVEQSQCATIAAALLTESASKGGQVPAELSKLMDYTARVAGDMGNRTMILVHDDGVGAALPGTAFHTAKANDSIVLLEGAEHPLVLRRAGDGWSFVGPAFLLGIMEGEAWSDENGVVENLQDFLLV